MNADVLFSVCPTNVATHVALEQGWLEEEIGKAGGSLGYLRALPDDNRLWPQAAHRLDNLIRDGGNSPPIWSHADIAPTKLVAITFLRQSGGKILVRADEDVFRTADLKGRRFGLIKGLNTRKIDFLRVPAERAIELALRLAGLAREDVTIVDIEHDDHAVEPSSQSPADRLTRLDRFFGNRSPDVAALAEGRVDAIYAAGAKAAFLEASGEFKVIEDLGRYPDWTLSANNTPYVTTASTKLADERPELIVAWLRATIRAGRWINVNRRAAAEIFHRSASRWPSIDLLEQSLGQYDFVPNLSPQAIAGVRIEKDFLLSHGYIENDFDVRAWIDDRFLHEALESLA